MIAEHIIGSDIPEEISGVPTMVPWRKWLIFCIMTLMSLGIFSQTQDEALVEEANRLFEAGQFQKAYGAFSQLVSLNPTSGDYNYKFGACSVYAEADKTKAVRYLKLAMKYNCTDPMVHYYLGRALHLNYQFKEAQDSYKSFISKANPKSKMIASAQLDMAAAANGSGLLSNIKDITVLNKTETDRVNFFRYYNLEGIGGKILSLPEELKTKLDKKNNHNAIIHFPGNGTTLYFSSYGKDGTTGKDIYRANVLPDGTYSVPEKLGGGVNTNADEDFCFMHGDGATLFFSSTGHNSMGGYDVFRSLYDAANNHFSAAVNLDFAINTPDDDIFYIADSLKQRAYFASGRSSDLEHLHVYNVLVESTPLQVVYFKGSYTNEINSEETGFGYSIKEKSSGRVVCSGNARNSDGGYVSFVPKSGEYVMSVITSQSPKVHEVSLTIPPFQKPVAIRQEAKLIDQGGDKLILETYFDTPLDEDLSALASDMLRSKARLEVNANEAPAPKKEETATISTYERSMQNAAMIAGFGSGATVEGVISQYKNDVETLVKEISDAKVNGDQAAKNAVFAQREAEKLLDEAARYKASGNPNQKSTLDSILYQVQLLKRADSLLILSTVFRESEKSLPEWAKQKQITLEKKNVSLNKLDSLYQAGDSENVISLLIAEKTNPLGTEIANLFEPYEDAVNERKLTLVQEQNKLTSLRKKEIETSDDIKSNEAILKRTSDAAERQNVEARLSVLQQDLTADRKRIMDQKLTILAANRKRLESEKLLMILKNPSQEIVAIASMDFAMNGPVSEAEFTALQKELNNKREALLIRDANVQMMIDEAGYGSDTPSQTPGEMADQVNKPSDNSDSPTELQLNSESAVAPSVEQVTSNDNGSSTSQTSGSFNISALESKYATELQLAAGRPDSLQIKSLVQYNAASVLLPEKIRLEKVLMSGNATSVDTTHYREVKEVIERIAQDSPKRITPLSNEALTNEMLRQDPEYIERKSALQNGVNSEESIEYKIQLIEQLMLARKENGEAISNSPSPQALSIMAKRDEEIERAVFTLLSEDAEIQRIKLQYDSAMQGIIESDMDYPQKLSRQYNLTLTYEKQLSQLAQAAAMSGITTESSAVKFVSAEREIIQVKLIAYKKELERTSSTGANAMATTQAGSSQQAKESISDTQNDTKANRSDFVDAEGNRDVNPSNQQNQVSNTPGSGAIAVSATPMNINGNSSIPVPDNQANATDLNNENKSTSVDSAYTITPMNVATSNGNQSAQSDISSSGVNADVSPPVIIDESAVFLAKANAAREEAGNLWQERAAPAPQVILSKPAQIGFSKVIASPQFKSMLYTSQSGKPIQRLNEYENNELEIESLDLRMKSANGNLDTLRALDSRRNKLLSVQNKIEIENAEEYSRIVKRNYNDQRLATDKRMGNLPSDVRNRQVLSEAMLNKLRKADSLMVEAVILKSEAAWAYNEEEKADLFKMALAKQIQSIEMLRQVELMGENSKVLMAMSDAEILSYARQTTGGDSATSPAVVSPDSTVNNSLVSENQSGTTVFGDEKSNGQSGDNNTAATSENLAATSSQSNTSQGGDNAVNKNVELNPSGGANGNSLVVENGLQTAKNVDIASPPIISGKVQPSNTNDGISDITSSSAGSSNQQSPLKQQTSGINNAVVIASDKGQKVKSDNSEMSRTEGNGTERNEGEASAPLYIDPYNESNNSESNKTEVENVATHTLVTDERIPTSNEQREMTRPEQAKWMISVLEEPEELPETEVYHTSTMQELIEQQSAERSLKNKDQLIQLNQQILLIEDQMSETTSRAQLRRLDYQREELYTQRASIEIENAAVMHEMAKHEYNERKLSADSILNNSVLVSELSPAIQEIIKEKNRLSDSLLLQSLVFRAQAENDVEPLEKAYYYREGFACQVKSIELMQQVKSIVYARPTLKTWSDSDIALMKRGKLPSELRVNTAVENEIDKMETSNASQASSEMNNGETAGIRENSDNAKTVATGDAIADKALIPANITSIATAAEVKTFYYKSPDRLTAELSLLNAKGVYSVNNPIPVDAPLPKGVYYKVQVGAFRNKIPQNLFDGFAPLHGESVNNGVVRYTAGFYMTLDRAKSAKNQIRDLGYKDAFVVAYKDGVRIPIYEAIKATEGQAAADLFAAANPGVVPTMKSTTSNTDTKEKVASTETNAQPIAKAETPPPPPLVTGYTKEYKDAAPSTEVETIQGVFFTVQVGVYTTPVPLSKLFNLKPLNTELTETKKIRYTTGRYETLESATARRDEIRAIGVKDAFVTAYMNGRRVTIAEALEHIKK